MDRRARAKAAPGVLAIVTADNAGKLGKGSCNTARLLGGPEIEHYHQAIARGRGRDVRAGARGRAPDPRASTRERRAPSTSQAQGLGDKPARITGGPSETAVGDFAGAFAAAPVKLDATYTTADESHSMMEPHATIAAWNGDQLTLWTSNQMIDWTAADLAKTLGIAKEKVRLISPFIGGGFGGKLLLRADALLAALGARAARRPVKVALPRALMPNNTVHRSATIQRIRIGATRDGKITAIAHESWSGNLPEGEPEAAAIQTRSLYAGPQPHDGEPPRRARPSRGERDARAGRSPRPDGAGDRDGRDGGKARDGSDRVPDPQRHPGRARQPPSPVRRPAVEAPRPTSTSASVLAAPAGRCLRPGAERFGWSKRNAQPGQVARRPLAGRHGRGRGDSAATRS